MKKIVVGLLGLLVILGMLGSSAFAQGQQMQFKGDVSVYANSDMTGTFTPRFYFGLLGLSVEGFADFGRTIGRDSFSFKNYYTEIQASVNFLMVLNLVAEVRQGYDLDPVKGYGLQAIIPLPFVFASISAYQNDDKTRNLTFYGRIKLPAKLYVEGWVDIYTKKKSFERDYCQGEIQIGREIGKHWRAVLEGRFCSLLESKKIIGPINYIGAGLQYFW